MKGVMMVMSMVAMTMVGCGGAKSGGSAAAPGELGVQVTENGFEPAIVTAPRGRAATLVITRKTDRTCATSAVFAALAGRKFELPLDQAVRIELPAERPDTLRYACGMGMYEAMVVSK